MISKEGRGERSGRGVGEGWEKVGKGGRRYIPNNLVL